MKFRKILHSIFPALITLCVLCAAYLALDLKHKSQIPREDQGKQLPFLVRESDYYIADTIAGHIHRPNAERIYDWKIHPRGKIVLRTNNLGFRNDRSTTQEKSQNVKRILITGDSHVDGVVFNDENVAHQLEILLNSSSGSETTNYEVLNGGVGYYSFSNYWGMLQRYAYLEPDVFIVIMYSGNDFLEAIAQAEKRNELTLPPRPRNYNLRLHRAASVKRRAAATFQALNQIYFFKHYRDLRAKALDLSKRDLSKIKNFCAERQISLLLVDLPAKIDVEWETDARLLEKVVEILRLSKDDLNINKEMSTDLAKWIQDQNISYIALDRAMESGQEQYFWKKDYHLNPTGHKLIAQMLYQKRKSWLTQ